MKRLSAFALKGIPEILPGDDLGSILLRALPASGEDLRPYDIVVVAQKVVSKAEGRVRTLDDFAPSTQAVDLAKQTGKDARKVEAILSESTDILRASKVPPGGLIIARHRHGWICANAAIDESNVGANRPKGTIVLLPEDPDRSARHLRDAAETSCPGPIGIIVSDTFGRPWRQGPVNVAIGTAGVPMIDDWVGRTGAYGRQLEITQLAFADEVATTAGMLMAKDGGTPFVVVRGLDWRPSPDARAQDVLRPIEKELFR